MNDLDFRLVDAFAFEPFTGNPAGVILDATGLSDPQMQLIAREVNASETTFVLPPTRGDAAVRFRWFTPGSEVRFCGHATLAGAHALLEAGRFLSDLREPGATLPIEFGGGVLNLRTEFQDDARVQTLYWFDSPDVTLAPVPFNEHKLLEFLGATPDQLDPRIPAVFTVERDVILGFKDLMTMLQLQPDQTRLAEYSRKHRLRGVCVTSVSTLSPTVACHSRFFAPAFGVPEDPVTGSLHGPLGTHLVRRGLIPAIDGRSTFQCAQGVSGGRQGVVRVVVSNDGGAWKARVGGACHTIAVGAMRRPAE